MNIIKTITTISMMSMLVSGCGDTTNNYSPTPQRWGNNIEYHIDNSLKKYPIIIHNIYNVLDSIEIIVPSLSFTEVSHKDDYVVTFKYVASENSSYVGKVLNPEVIISSGRLTTAEHEIRHMLGIPHEHQRPDRDDYIKIDLASIPSDILPYFVTYSPEAYIYDVYKYPYDTKSIMHYCSSTFGVTIKTTDNKDVKYNVRPTLLDNKKLNDLFN